MNDDVTAFILSVNQCTDVWHSMLRDMFGDMLGHGVVIRLVGPHELWIQTDHLLWNKEKTA